MTNNNHIYMYIEKYSLFLNRSETPPSTHNYPPTSKTRGTNNLNVGRLHIECVGLGGGGSKIGKFMKRKEPKSTLLADNIRGLIATKQTKPRRQLLRQHRIPSLQRTLISKHIPIIPMYFLFP